MSANAVCPTPEQNAVFALIEEEMAAVVSYCAAAGLPLDTSRLSATNPLFYVTFTDADGAKFWVEIDAREYGKYPPTIEFVDESHQERGQRRLYSSCFHQTPCVCMRYNRKAYTAQGGPHGDWRMIDWQLPTVSGVAIDTLALIVSDLHSKISSCRGRLG